METTVNAKSSALVRGLGFSASVAVVIGSMIGQGIFLVPSQVARSVGSVTWALAAWLVGGTIVLFATFCYAELGAALPHTGKQRKARSADREPHVAHCGSITSNSSLIG